LQQPKDWFSVTLEELADFGGIRIQNKTPLQTALNELYPHIDWSNLHRWHGRFSQQRYLERTVSSLFPEEEMLVNARKQTQLQNDVTGSWLELDVWLPQLNLAFKYQVFFSSLSPLLSNKPSHFILLCYKDTHHYKASRYEFKILNTYQTRDAMKRVKAVQQGITLIIVPFWWDRTPQRYKLILTQFPCVC
jgi:hypothetical protein